MVKSKSIWSDQNHFGPTKTILDRTKPFWTDQNCFGHIEGQGIRIQIGKSYWDLETCKKSLKNTFIPHLKVDH